MIISSVGQCPTDNPGSKRAVTQNIQNSFSSENFTLYGELVKLSEEKKMYFFKPTPLVDYRKCVLTEGDDWTITYYVGKAARV